jgi:hypothetical protein
MRMTLSLTCKCGARLDIDEKFAGQLVHCPDCNLPLDTGPPPTKATRTSDLALASLLLALIGAFTIVGTIAAVACGFLALAQIRRAKGEIGGMRFARAGIALGSAFTLVTAALLWSTELLRVDGWLRVIESAGKIDYDLSDEISIQKSGGFDGGSGTIRRPTRAWGRLPNNDPNILKPDDLVLVNLWEDAYILCLTRIDAAGQTLEECRQEGLKSFLESNLITRILGRITDDAPPTGKERDKRDSPNPNDESVFVFDVRLRSVDWTFLIRVRRVDNNRLTVVAAGTRKSRFDRLEPTFVKALDSFKVEN